MLAQAVTWFGAIRGSLVWIGVGRLLLGMGRSGGALAWQLGLRLPGFEGLGGHLIGVACLIGTFGALGYWRLHRQVSRQIGSGFK